jgi:diacylglycerol kinase family enzyme
VARGLLVVNPFASRVTPEAVERVAAVLRDVDVVRTERPGHASELVRTAGGEAEAIYVFSGDGGFNEALNGSDGRTPLGFVPGGGTSVLPRALGLPRDPVAAARRLAEGRTARISVGRVNGRRFGFSAGLGLDAELIRRGDALGRSSEGRRAGDVAFTRAALGLLWERRARFDPVLELRGHGRLAFALVANCDPYTYVGRVPLHVAPQARFELGLDVVGPRVVRPSSLPRFVAYILRGRGQERAGGVVYLHDVDRLAAVCDRPTALQVDGEDLGDVTQAVFEAERNAVVVLT